MQNQKKHQFVQKNSSDLKKLLDPNDTSYPRLQYKEIKRWLSGMSMNLAS